MRIYKSISLVLALLFAITGILFLSIPDKVLMLFNTLSSYLGMPPSPVIDWNFYLILAAAYMYVVTILAFLMFKHPANRYFSLLLIHAKLASSILSLALFLLHAQYLIYLANFIVDGVIGFVVLSLYLKTRKVEWVCS